MKNTCRRIARLGIVALALTQTAAPALAEAISSAFTYQGKLTTNTGQIVPDGSYTMTFRLFDDLDPAPPENQIGATVSRTAAVAGGVFSVDLDFGAAGFAGQKRWLETTVAGTPLSPRMEITATPNAIYAQTTPWSGVLGAPASMPPSGNAAGDLDGTYPNPTIGADKVTSTKLSSDPASLAKVSGGAMTSSGDAITICSSTPTAPPLVVQCAYNREDQTQTTMGYDYMGDIIWQSFRAGKTGQLEAISVYLAYSNWSGTLRICNGTGTGGAVLASQPAAYPGSGWQTFTLTAPVPVVAGNSYTFYFNTVGGLGVKLQVSTANPYADGLMNPGGDYDCVFKTHVRGIVPVIYAQPGTCNVGIGTSDPEAQLDVAGSIKMLGFQLGTSATAGEVLMADAHGVGHWGVLTSLPSYPYGPAGGDLTGGYPNPSIANDAVTDSKIADVAWSKVLNKPTSMPPSGTAGGELAGTYPNPTIGVSAIDSTNLASDPASLGKVSGGVMSVSAGNVSTTGRINKSISRSGASGNGGSNLAIDFAPANMDHGEVHFGNTYDNQWVDAWLTYANGGVMGNYIKHDGTTTTIGHFKLTASGALVYSKTNASDSSGYLYYNAATSDILVYEAAAGNNYCEWFSVDQRN